MADTLHLSPAERRRNRVRATILSAAERVFAREGGEALSIRRLAEAIDYSPAAIYKYFRSKEDLLEELKEAFFERLLEKVNDQPEAEQPFAVGARDCVATYVRLAVEKPHHYAAAFTGQAAAMGPNVDAPDFAQSKKGQAFMVLLEMVQEGVANRSFRQDLDPALAAKSVWVSMHGLAMMMTHLPCFPAFGRDLEGPISSDEFIDYHADLVVRGLEAAK